MRGPDAARAGIEEAAILLSAMCNPVRLGVLRRLTEREWSVNELAADIQLSQSALSQHLTKLRNARAVQVRRERQHIFYSCDHAVVLRLLHELGLIN
ncbi:MAG: hypothetical protein ABS35_20320 [Kaistia sp. SCN 65-12]|nr:MAG: hypothetical protein ABS35_20320 [Kaistia sp. SCN 65-12]